MKTKKIHIELLLEKYFDGQTSLNEEKTLRNYFRQTHIPESLEVYRPMFTFFNEEIGEEQPEIRQSSRVVWIRWTGIGAAAAIMLFFGIKFTFHDARNHQPESMVYIDGKKFTDLQTIEKETLNTLDLFSSTDDDVISTQIDMLESLDGF